MGLSKVLFSSASQHWNTPRAVYDALDAEFHFNFDPCPPGHSEVPLFGEGSIYRSWAGKRVFCNPPYGPKILDFVSKGKEPDVAVFLLPARTDTKWFHEIVLPGASEIRFLKGRLSFGNGNGPAPFPSLLAIFRSDVEQRASYKMNPH
jgi:site-specific DNA-methyltransferase (adenine-specific)